MKKIAIQGHPTRGKEVIQILKDLGGKGSLSNFGYDERMYYWINSNDIILESLINIKTKKEFNLYTLEEFEKEGKFTETCLNGIKQDIVYDPDYWTKLEHQYAGMAMQGILANIDLLMSLTKKKDPDYPAKYTVAEFAKDCAHALVEKMKEERK